MGLKSVLHRNRKVWKQTILLQLTLLILPSILWIWKDHSVWSWDPAWYGEVTLDLFYTLLHDGPKAWFAAGLKAFGVKAPAIAWLGEWFVPLRFLFGSAERALLVFVVACQICSLMLFYRLAKSFTKGDVGLALFGALFFSSGPLFIGLTHVYFVEPLQTLGLVWLILTCWNAPNRSIISTVGQLIIGFDIAIAAKVSTPLYCVGPMLILLYHCYFRRFANVFRAVSLKYNRYDILLLCVAAIASLFTVLWFSHNLHLVRDFVNSATNSKTAELWGRRAPFLDKLLYWLNALKFSYFFDRGGPIFVVIFSSAVCLRAVSRKRATDVDYLALISFVQIALALIVFSTQMNEETRYLLPLGPYVAMLVIWCAQQLFAYRVIRFILVTLVLLQWGALNCLSLGYFKYAKEISPWVLPAHEDEKDFQRMKQVVSATCQASDGNRTNVISAEVPYFNANSASFFRAKLGGPVCYYTSLGLAEDDLERASERMRILNIKHFIALDPATNELPSDSLNSVSVKMVQRVQANKNFKEIKHGKGGDFLDFVREIP